jgi:hypothetical protein
MKEYIQELAQNRKVQLLGALLLFGIVIFMLSLGMTANRQSTTTSTRASESNASVRISFDRTSLSALPHEEVKLILSAQPSTGTQQIQGYRFVLEFSPKAMQIVDMKYKLGRPSVELGNHGGNLTKANEDGKLIVQGEDQTAMGTTLDSATSKNIVELTLVLFSSGSPNIELQEDAFNNVIAIKNDGPLETVPIVLGQSPDFSVERQQSSSDEPKPEDVAIDIQTQMQGIQSGLNVVMPLHLTAIDSTGTRYGTLLEMTNDVSGIWSGKTTLPLVEGSSYKFLLQSNRHMSTPVCDEQPQEEELGTYECPETAALEVTGSTLTLDASGILMLSGDLPEQDNIIDALDVTRIRSLLGRTDGEALYSADVNYDGIVDTQDHGLVITSLQKNKQKEQPSFEETIQDNDPVDFDRDDLNEEEESEEQTGNQDDNDQFSDESDSGYESTTDDEDESEDSDSSDLESEYFNNTDEDSDATSEAETSEDDSGTTTNSEHQSQSESTDEETEGDSDTIDIEGKIRDNIGNRVKDVTEGFEDDEDE